ncbi:MAG TPA: transglycosylase SLT domain-containing protein, partial [Elusimicrobiota bacterium]|nr:transglycosylase SLT domain-containing protein [Elusimicrobiota bacterium]
MKTSLVPPVALLALLAWAATLRDDASPLLLPPSAPLPTCLAWRSLGPDGGRRYDSVILRHARRCGVNPRLVKAIIAAESQFRPSAVSPCGARGLMQVMPATAEELGVRACDLSDPETNISAGTEYLARLFRAARRGRRQAGSRSRVVRRVIAAYHSGPRELETGAWSPATRLYVRKVLNC